MIVFREQLNNFFTEKIKILSQCSALGLDGLNFITTKSKLFTLKKTDLQKIFSKLELNEIATIS